MRIVIIDDEEVICDGIRRTIESSNEEWEIEAVYSDPEEALEFTDWDRVDLLLADIGMPNMNGLELVDALRERGCDTQVVFISGHTDFAYAKRAIQQDAVDYIVKPISVPNLLCAVKKAEDEFHRRKALLEDKEYLKQNVRFIAKGLVYDILFETRRIYDDELSSLLRVCSLEPMTYFVFHVFIPTESNCLKHVTAFKRSDCFLFSAGRRLFTVVLVEDTALHHRAPRLRTELERVFPGIVISGIGTAEELRDLPGVSEKLMREFARTAYHPASASGESPRTEAIPPNVENHYGAHVRKTMEYIHNHYADKISLRTLSECIFVHPAYLSNLFKQQTGQTITEYTNRFRIELAKQLLQDPRNKIYWIAEQVGFVNQRYFGQVFKKFTGCTAVQYKHTYFLEFPDTVELA